ncbi:MAG: hypothetical protein D6731_02700 [Planctomycetota bacterium]|nr:MAG: hypothetical protein D6731_02700 [Planctomycetota bacterium]
MTASATLGSTPRPLAFAVASLFAAASLFVAGCGGDSGDVFVSDGDQGQAVAANTQATGALTSLAVEASLNQADAANFTALQTPPQVTATGSATNGTVSLDFGTGTVVNNATVEGVLTADFTASGASGSISATVTVTFSNLRVQTARGGDATLNGQVTVSVTTTGSTATGSITGSVTAVSNLDTVTVTPSLTYTINGSPTGGTVQLGGTVGIDSQRYGDWTATFTNLLASITATARDITQGSLALTRNSSPSVTVTLTFTAPNQGTLTVTPSGVSTSFTL